MKTIISWISNHSVFYFVTENFLNSSNHLLGFSSCNKIVFSYTLTFFYRVYFESLEPSCLLTNIRHFKLVFIDAVFRAGCFLNLSQCKFQEEKGNLQGILKTFVTSYFKWSMNSPLVNF